MAPAGFPRPARSTWGSLHDGPCVERPAWSSWSAKCDHRRSTEAPRRIKVASSTLDDRAWTRPSAMVDGRPGHLGGSRHGRRRWSKRPRCAWGRSSTVDGAAKEERGAGLDVRRRHLGPTDNDRRRSRGAPGPALVGMPSVDEAACVGAGEGVERRRSHLAAWRWFLKEAPL
jgi:hypothetical protein